MGTAIDPCDLDLDMLTIFRDLVCFAFCMPVGLGRGDREGEGHAGPLFYCMKGVVKVIVAFWGTHFRKCLQLSKACHLVEGECAKREGKEGQMRLSAMSQVLH